MKKRFVAFLLVLIMVLGMLPVSALAADKTWGVSVQIGSGNYYTSAGAETHTNKYDSSLHMDDSCAHRLGCQF